MIERLLFTGALVTLAAVLFLAERVVPLRRATRPLLGRLLVNLGVSALAFVAAMLLVRPAAMRVLEWATVAHVGVVQWGPMPLPVQFVVSFLLMDLTFYWWHMANHRLPFLWRFHNVHHLDPDLDVSTAFRFHWGEVALSVVFRVVQVSTIGLSAWMFAVYELVFQANTVFHHSNVRLPIRVERVLNVVLVTPRMHGIHHSCVRDETDSNYSVVFSWWDRLHRTLGLDVPQAEIVIGVPGYSEPVDNTFRNLLLLPFRRQRDYWASPQGSPERRGRARYAAARSRLAE